MCPGQRESGGKQHSAATRKGSKWLRGTLTECAKAVVRTKGTYVSARYHRIKSRRGHAKATVATAHKILTAATTSSTAASPTTNSARNSSTAATPRPPNATAAASSTSSNASATKSPSSRYRRPPDPKAPRVQFRFSYQEGAAPLGHDYFHAIIDDHSRLAYGELLSDEKADAVTAFTERALAWFASLGITSRRLMTDGAWSDTRNRDLRQLLAQRQIRHIVAPPYTPRCNGKVERFHQTMEREWAEGVRYANSTARNQPLPHWLSYYNQRRPHNSLGNWPPISRARNLLGQDS